MILTGVRYFAVLGILGLMAILWPSLHLDFVDLLILSVLLSLVDALWSGILGRTFSPKYTGFLGWLSGVAVLYGVGSMIPGVHMTALAALSAGSALWLVGHIFPAVYG